MNEDIVEEMFSKEKIIDGYDKWVDDLQKENFELTKECNKLETNWNELKKSLEEKLKITSEKWGRNCANEFDLGCLDIEITVNVYGEILKEMQELEQGKDVK